MRRINYRFSEGEWEKQMVAHMQPLQDVYRARCTTGTVALWGAVLIHCTGVFALCQALWTVGGIDSIDKSEYNT